MWRAPEFLDTNQRGSQKGDIYSFAIICSEILTREDPYAMYELEVDGKIYETWRMLSVYELFRYITIHIYFLTSCSKNFDLRTNKFIFESLPHLNENLYLLTPKYNMTLTLVEVINRLKARENPPFRPNIKNTTLGNMDLRDPLTFCWADSPEQRPDVGKVKVLIRELTSRFVFLLI